jgi:hypothetical protein
MSQDRPAVRQTNQSFFFEADIFSARRPFATIRDPPPHLPETPEKSVITADSVCAIVRLRLLPFDRM